MIKDIVLSDGISSDYLHSVHDFIREWESESPLITLATSGSTGVPKHISFSKDQLIASAKMTGDFFGLNAGDAVLLNLSPEYVAAKLMIVRAWVHGLNLVLAPVSANPLIDLKPFKPRVKFGAFVPYQMRAILANTESCKRYNEIDQVLIGGAAIPQELELAIARQTTQSYASFGMTETLTHFALRKIDGSTKSYTCLPGVTIAQATDGCLIVNPNAVVQDAVLSTDVIHKMSEKEFIWLGRKDYVINSGGVKIHPEQIEKLIEPILQDRKFYISSQKSELLGEEVVLVLEGESSMPLADNLMEQLKKALPAYHSPKSIIYQSKFAETESGKIKRVKF